MIDRYFTHAQVVEITGLSPRQILSWTEKGLVPPKKPARKAGSRREYNYCNLLEFLLARFLLDELSLQFYMAKKLLDELRTDGELDLWAMDYTSFLSYKSTVKDKEGDELIGSHTIMRDKDPYGLGGTVSFIPKTGKKSKTVVGSLVYLIFKEGDEVESVRVIMPYEFDKIGKILSEEFEHKLSEAGAVIFIDLARLKNELDRRLEG